MPPQRLIVYDPANRRSRDMLNHSLFLEKIEANITIELTQVLVLVKMLNGTPNIVNLTHDIVMFRPDKQFCSSLELLFCLAWLRQDQPINATCILMKSFENVRYRSRFLVEVKN